MDVNLLPELLTPAGRRFIADLIKDPANVSPREIGFRVNDLSALGTVISDAQGIKHLLEQERLVAIKRFVTSTVV